MSHQLDDGLREFLSTQTCLQEVCLRHLNNPLNLMFLVFKSKKLEYVNLGYTGLIADKGKKSREKLKNIFSWFLIFFVFIDRFDKFMS